jgi:hypothetical protein
MERSRRDHGGGSYGPIFYRAGGIDVGPAQEQLIYASDADHELSEYSLAPTTFGGPIARAVYKQSSTIPSDSAQQRANDDTDIVENALPIGTGLP